MSYLHESGSLSKALGISLEEWNAILHDLEELSLFSYEYRIFSELPKFLEFEPYASFLKGNQGVILGVCTLGPRVERKIQALQLLDLRQAYLYDFAASRLVEQKADAYEKSLGMKLSQRFCPGYAGSDITDVQKIFDLVLPKAVHLNQGGMMSPSKSMAGILGIGISKQVGCSFCKVCTKEES